MNYLVVNSVCCCLSICCKEVWETLYKIIGKVAFIKFVYILIYLGSVCISLALVAIMNSSWSWVMPNLAPGITCNDVIVNEGMHVDCVTVSSIYRISLCLLVFSIVMITLLMACGTRVGLVLNEGLFFSKFVIVLGMFFGTLYMNNSVFMAYGNVAQAISYVFVVVQSIILIDLSYLWGIKWAKKYSQGSRRYAILLIITSILMFAASLFFIISSFTSHHNSLLWANIVCCIQIGAMIGIQILNFNKQNSLLTTSSLCLLVSYWTWAAGFSHPETQVEGNFDETLLYFNMAISLILLLLSTAGSIYGSTNAEEDNHFIDLDNLKNNEEQSQENRGKWLQWLLYLAGLSAYLSMIVTDWGSADIVHKEFNLTTGAWSSKLMSAWTVVIIYIWTLLAPKICPHRNFYFE